MSSPLGKIDKPEAGQYKEGRKIFLVPLFLSPPNGPDDLKALLEEYWEEAGEHVARLEASLGPVSHIFHETVFLEGEEGAAMLEQINPLAYRILRARYYSGAALEATEDMELVQETTDWQRCLVSGLTSEKVFTTVVESYNDAVARRYQHISEENQREHRGRRVGYPRHRRATQGPAPFGRSGVLCVSACAGPPEAVD